VQPLPARRRLPVESVRGGVPAGARSRDRPPLPTDDEPDVARLTDHHELDLETPVREAIQLAEPIAPLCRPDCPGLCIVCGGRSTRAHDHPDDDIDPRLEALRAFRPTTLTVGPISRYTPPSVRPSTSREVRARRASASPPAMTEGAPDLMGVPKRRVSHARQGERRSHLAISVPTLEECSHCHEMKLPHHVCPNCGYYQGRLAVELKHDRRRRRALTR
jgi:large subunit ribosomal protein L32